MLHGSDHEQEEGTNRYTNRDAVEEKEEREREESKRSQNIIVTAVHKRALY
jgi:hypothetical protein